MAGLNTFTLHFRIWHWMISEYEEIPVLDVGARYNPSKDILSIELLWGPWIEGPRFRLDPYPMDGVNLCRAPHRHHLISKHNTEQATSHSYVDYNLLVRLWSLAPPNFFCSNTYNKWLMAFRPLGFSNISRTVSSISLFLVEKWPCYILYTVYTLNSIIKLSAVSSSAPSSGGCRQPFIW